MREFQIKNRRDLFVTTTITEYYFSNFNENNKAGNRNYQ